MFMISACVFTDFLFHPYYPALRLVPNAAVCRMLMGIAMGVTAILIIHSSMGKRSGAHFNPAITLTYLRLGTESPLLENVCPGFVRCLVQSSLPV